MSRLGARWRITVDAGGKSGTQCQRQTAIDEILARWNPEDVSRVGWQPALPITQDATWDEYLAGRFAQVLERADATFDLLPDTRWAAALQENEPELAQQVNLWRAAHDVDASDFRPCGPLDREASAFQRQLGSRVQAALGGLVGDTDRWRPLVDRIAPGLADDPHWPVLARGFSRASAAGYDVEAHLPALIAARPLPESHAARSLDYRLADACPEAFEPIRSTHYERPAKKPTPPAPAPDYARAFGNPSVSRGGPRR